MRDLIKCTTLICAPLIGGLIVWGLDSLHLVQHYGFPFLIGLSLWAISKIWEIK